MNLLDRKQQEEFFHDHLTGVLPQKHGIRVAASSYDEEWSALRYTTPAGPLIVRINDIEKPKLTFSTARVSLRGCWRKPADGNRKSI